MQNREDITAKMEAAKTVIANNRTQLRAIEKMCDIYEKMECAGHRLNGFDQVFDFAKAKGFTTQLTAQNERAQENVKRYRKMLMLMDKMESMSGM